MTPPTKEDFIRELVVLATPHVDWKEGGAAAAQELDAYVRKLVAMLPATCFAPLTTSDGTDRDVVAAADAPGSGHAELTRANARIAELESRLAFASTRMRDATSDLIAAVAAEREACARECTAWGRTRPEQTLAAEHCAARIRKRP